ncbi:MAG: DUF6933 domain-containing protein [Anaerovoracaceae bacterium]
MEYGVAEKLKEKSKLAYLREAGQKNLLLCWESEVVKKDGQDVLLIVNAATRYCTVLTDLEEVEWLDLRHTIEKGVKDAIRGAGIPDLFINTYYENAGEAELTVPHGEDAVEGLRYIAQAIEGSSAEESLEELVKKLNRELCTTAAFPAYEGFYPDDMFRGQMKSLLAGEELILEYAKMKDGTLIRKGKLILHPENEGAVIDMTSRGKLN